MKLAHSRGENVEWLFAFGKSNGPWHSLIREVVMRRFSALVLIVLVGSIAIFWVQLNPTKAQEAPAGGSSPSDVIDQMMMQISQNRIDNATALMGNLRSTPDLRSAARDQLDHLHDDQGTYHGYEIVAIQKISNQFQTFNVMAYYDQQPVLLRFHFYRPQAAASWNVIGFQAVTSIADMTEVLKDTPIDYPFHKITK
jgi:hypothetical protein